MAQTFEIGLVMAGAISAGAYTAGVVDFLFEALDDYYAARESAGWDGPRHDVRIPIMSGASAGGMTAAIASLHAFRGLKSVWPGQPTPQAQSNRLYSSWVDQISIERLLETSDLRNGASLQSALCCDVLDEIVKYAFAIDEPAQPRKWIGGVKDPTLRLRLTVTNTRGIPYSFNMFGRGATEKFGMLRHADYCEFAVGHGEAVKAAAREGVIGLDADDFAADNWSALRQAALATGAFPVGLKPRVIHREDTGFYFSPSFSLYSPDESFRKEGAYDFVAVDGGTIDNEPLELARRYLEGEDGAAETKGTRSSRALVLVAPFPNRSKNPPESTDVRLVGVVGALITSLKEQARFKPDELAKAQDDENFSRYMIAPTRKGNNSEASEIYPIACGVMGGFGGFLHRSFRRHDYLLGRRNAQAFLRWNFGLPASNPLFGGVKFPERWNVKDAEGRSGTLKAEANPELADKLYPPAEPGGKPQCGYPIIPLTERMQKPIEISLDELPRPGSVDLKRLERQVRGRARSAFGALIDNDLPQLFPALAGLVEALLKEGAREFGAHVATEWAMKHIGDALQDVAAAFEPQ